MIWSLTRRDGDSVATMQRICELIQIRPEAIAEYKRIHAEVWPTVLARLRASNITNYSIYLREQENLLIAYYEYVGDDLAADKAAIAADPETQRWWVVADPMQQPLSSLPPAEGSQGGGWWASTEEVFHLD